MELCREMLKNTSCFDENDILINNRGVLSREMTNYLKTERKTDTYVPARETWTYLKTQYPWLFPVVNGRNTQIKKEKTRKYSL